MMEGDARRLSVLLRFSDERGLQRWEQVISLTVLVEARDGHLLMTPNIEDLGEPRKTPAEP